MHKLKHSLKSSCKMKRLLRASVKNTDATLRRIVKNASFESRK